MSALLPRQIQEWLDLAERLKISTLVYDEDYYRAAARLDPHEIDELAKLYDRVLRDNEIDLLHRWLLTQRGNVPISHEEAMLRNLVHLWFCLYFKRYPQFVNSKPLDLSGEWAATPDWSWIPPEFGFLSAPADKYSKFVYVCSPEGQDIIQKAVTDEERIELGTVADQLRSVGYAKFQAWKKGLNVRRHVEAMRLFNLIGVLEALSLDYS